MKNILKSIAIISFGILCSCEEHKPKVQIHNAKYEIVHTVPSTNGNLANDSTFYCEEFKMNGSAIEFEDIYGNKYVLAGNIRITENK